MSEKNWWEKYPKINSAKFTNENSGKFLGGMPPYGQSIAGELKKIVGVSSMFEIVGFTLNPPFQAPFPNVAIMFERKDDFSQIWFHYGR